MCLEVTVCVCGCTDGEFPHLQYHCMGLNFCGTKLSQVLQFYTLSAN